LNNTVAEKVGTQNPVHGLLTAVAQRAEVYSQDRFWKIYAGAHRMQIAHLKSKALPIYAKHYLPIAKKYTKRARRPEIDSANPSARIQQKIQRFAFPSNVHF
jgi:hypothetical protein